MLFRYENIRLPHDFYTFMLLVGRCLLRNELRTLIMGAVLMLNVLSFLLVEKRL